MTDGKYTLGIPRSAGWTTTGYQAYLKTSSAVSYTNSVIEFKAAVTPGSCYAGFGLRCAGLGASAYADLNNGGRWGLGEKELSNGLAVDLRVASVVGKVGLAFTDGTKTAGSYPTAIVDLPAGVDITAENSYRVIDTGDTIYAFVNGMRLFTVKLEGLSDGWYTKATVYDKDGAQRFSAAANTNENGYFGFYQRDAGITVDDVAVKTLSPNIVFSEKCYGASYGFAEINGASVTGTDGKALTFTSTGSDPYVHVALGKVDTSVYNAIRIRYSMKGTVDAGHHVYMTDGSLPFGAQTYTHPAFTQGGSEITVVIPDDVRAMRNKKLTNLRIPLPDKGGEMTIESIEFIHVTVNPTFGGKSFDKVTVNGELKVTENAEKWLADNPLTFNHTAENTVSFEGWAQVYNGTIKGFGYSVDGKDTVRKDEFLDERSAALESAGVPEANGFNLGLNTSELDPGDRTVSIYVFAENPETHEEFSFKLYDVTLTVKTVEFDRASLTLASNTGINFKLPAEAFENGAYKDPYAVFTLNGRETVVKDYKIADGLITFSFYGMSPDEMGDTVTAVLHAKLGEEDFVSEPIRYSVAEYCYGMLRNSAATDGLKKVIVSLLNYGAATQSYTGKDTEALVNKDLTAEEKALVTAVSGEYATDAKDVVKNDGAEGSGIVWRSAGLRLEGKISVRFALGVEEGTDVSDLKVAVKFAGGEYVIESKDFVKVSDKTYAVYFDGVNAHQMKQTVQATCYRGNEVVSDTACYSVEAYAGIMSNGDGADTLTQLLNAMMTYGEYAIAYTK